jgi:hypothetical protein
MFRDDAQASRAIHLLLAGQGLASLWSDPGPSGSMLRTDGGPLLSEPQRALLRAALSLWPPLAAGIALAELSRTLDRASCQALCSLMTACADGPDAVDAWIDEAASGAPGQAEVVRAPSIAEDWPTLDALSLRYVHSVLAHTRNNRTRAAKVLGVDRRTVNRLLAAAALGVMPLMQTQRKKGDKPP